VWYGMVWYGMEQQRVAWIVSEMEQNLMNSELQ